MVKAFIHCPFLFADSQAGELYIPTFITFRMAQKGIEPKYTFVSEAELYPLDH